MILVNVVISFCVIEIIIKSFSTLDSSLTLGQELKLVLPFTYAAFHKAQLLIASYILFLAYEMMPGISNHVVQSLDILFIYCCLIIFLLKRIKISRIASL